MLAPRSGRALWLRYMLRADARIERHYLPTDERLHFRCFVQEGGSPHIHIYFGLGLLNQASVRHFHAKAHGPPLGTNAPRIPPRPAYRKCDDSPCSSGRALSSGVNFLLSYEMFIPSVASDRLASLPYRKVVAHISTLGTVYSLFPRTSNTPLRTPPL